MPGIVPTCPMIAPGFARFRLPWPPSVNAMYRAGEGGKRRLTDKVQKFYSDVQWELLRQRVPRRDLKSRLEVSLELRPPNLARWDLDNRPKVLLDALEHYGVFVDDSQIDRLVLTRGAMVRGGSCIVEIRERST